jgi:hypothetical protein
MRISDRLLRGFCVGGLALVIGLLCWLILMERKLTNVTRVSVADESQRTELDGLRETLYGMRERHKKVSALDFLGRLHKASNSLGALTVSVEEVESELGSTLIPDTPEPFQPQALFVNYVPGWVRVRFLGWKLLGGSAAYRFMVTYSHYELPEEIFENVRQGEQVSELRIVSSSSPTRVGTSYKKHVRTTARGKEITETRKHPNFRVVRLLLERASTPSEDFSLEVAHSGKDERSAKLSGYSFEDTAQCGIPLAELEIRDHPDSEARSITVKKGSRFEFAGNQYVVREIHPDHVRVSSIHGLDATEKWTRTDKLSAAER